MTAQSSAQRWYSGVTGYQWLVLAIASAGWVFDAFEGQIFNITRNQMFTDILGVSNDSSDVKYYGDVFLAIFLVGGTVGGLFFSWLADKWGRRPTMALTILMYSVFSGLTFFAHSLWQVGMLRFLVATGVGGEWAVAAALVAEVFPQHARAHASGFFHATSVAGTWLSAIAGMAVGAHWRYAYLIGIGPALLTLLVRHNIKEPESWKAAGAKAAQAQGPKMGSFHDLLFNPRWSRRAILGMLLAAIGLGTFWCITVAGQNIAKELLLRDHVPNVDAERRAQFAYGIVQTIGGLVGLLSFAPLSVRWGRRPTFMLMHLGAFFIVPLVCYVPQTYTQLLLLLPAYGFLTFGSHAGYAIYFPELFPNHLRATGTGFCFNGGRMLAALILIFSAKLKAMHGMDLRFSLTLLGILYPLGIAVIYFMPETKGQPLPE